MNIIDRFLGWAWRRQAQQWMNSQISVWESQIKAAKEESNRHLDECRKELNEAEAKLEGFQMERDSLRSIIEELEEQNSIEAKEKEFYKEELAFAKKEIEARGKCIDGLNQIISDWIAERDLDIAQLESDRDSETRWASQYKAERDAANATLDALREVVRNGFNNKEVAQRVVTILYPPSTTTQPEEEK